MPGPEALKALAAAELTQLEEEGCDTRQLRELYEQAITKGPGRMRADLERFFSRTSLAEPAEAFEFEEPSDLDGIRAARASGPRRLRVDTGQAREHIHGAWLGRCAGCMLGKPVEGWTREQIAALLELAGEYPLSDYFPPIENAPEGMRVYNSAGNTCLRGNIRFGERDDDTDYTILGLHIMETYGPEFTSADVAAEWLARLPYDRVYTAERAAYRNLVNDIVPPDSATVMNPYREWIGAQIRCDGFAYCAAGWPERAAEFAWRDAVVSHTKNGIYGEMFFAALISACMATDDLHEAIAAARAEIPDRSRLARAIDDTVGWCEKDKDWETTWARMNEKYGHYHPVHTINNAVIVLLGCLHAHRVGQASRLSPGEQFERAICISVMGGLDTDCNGATAGSVMGALLGVSGVPEKWTAPLRDTLHSALEGVNVNKISDLARRTVAVAENIGACSTTP